MEKSFSIIKQTRANFIKMMEGLSIEQLNKIPPNFNNNIIWNFVHIVASQQALCYKLANREVKIPAEYVSKYSKGTRPEGFVQSNELDILKEYSLTTLDELIVDYKNGHFSDYNPYMTSYGVSLDTIDDAIRFVIVHEGLHFGYAMALKRAVIDTI